MTTEIQNIQWFPGHMAKTRRLIKESLPLIDAVAEILDARIPLSSRNPEILQLTNRKPRIILLNKCDMAAEHATRKWIEYYKKQGITALPVDCKTGKGLDRFLSAVKELLRDKLKAYQAKGVKNKKLRIMVLGIPNSGKSSFINRMNKNKGAKVENRPGVTRSNQWYTIDKTVEMLDTPGVLWPKFEDPVVGQRLAFTGAVRDSIIDIETLALELLGILSSQYKNELCGRYGLSEDAAGTPDEWLKAIGRKRGNLIPGGEVDTERTAVMLMEEFRGGKIGRITLELP